MKLLFALFFLALPMLAHAHVGTHAGSNIATHLLVEHSPLFLILAIIALIAVPIVRHFKRQ